MATFVKNVFTKSTTQIIMTSVPSGHSIHDLDAKPSSRVLNRPGGKSNMDGIFSDPIQENKSNYEQNNVTKKSQYPYRNESSIVFGDDITSGPPEMQARAQQRQQQQQQQTSNQNNQKDYQPSIRVRAPPGGHSSITFG